jgi:hypothetical protein
LFCNRLDNVPISSDPLGFFFVVGFKLAGQKQHRDVLEIRVLLDIFADLIAGATRHEYVCQDQIRAYCGKL